MYAAAKYAFDNSDAVPEDEIDLVVVDLDSLPENVKEEDLVFDEATGTYYADAALVGTSAGNTPAAVKSGDGNVVSVAGQPNTGSQNSTTAPAAQNTQTQNNRTQNNQTTQNNQAQNNQTAQNTAALEQPTVVADDTPIAQPQRQVTPAAQPAPAPEASTAPAHVHNWQPVYRTVHHDAVTHQEPVYKTVHHDAVTHQEEVFEDIWVDDQVVQGDFVGYASIDYGVCICHTCHQEYEGYDAYHAHSIPGGGWCDSDGYKTDIRYREDPNQPIYDQVYVPGHYEKVSKGVQTVTDKEAYDEQVLDGYTTVTDQAAYDEQVLAHYSCSCGATK